MYFLIYCFAWVAFDGVAFGCCDCCVPSSAHAHNYEDYCKFPNAGMDIYVVDNIDNVDQFKEKYSMLYSFNYRTRSNEKVNLTDEEEIVLKRSCTGKKKIVKIYNHYQDWCIHFYNIKNWFSKPGNNCIEELLNVLKKNIGTTGGNNYDVKTCRDVGRLFEAWRSKVRHNKNVLIFNLDRDVKDVLHTINNNLVNDIMDEQDDRIKQNINTVVRIFKSMISFSYCPEIIFLYKDNLNVDNLYESIKKTEDDWEKNNEVLYPPAVNHSNTGWLVRGDRFDNQRIKFLGIANNDNYVPEMCQNLQNTCYFHNMSDAGIRKNDINIAITGWKRSGKTTLANLLVNGRIGKSSNDLSSVTRKAAVYHHSNLDTNFSVVDTQGIEQGEDYAKLFLEWLDDPACDENYDFYLTDEDMSIGNDKVVLSVQNSRLYISTDSMGANRKIVGNLWKKGVGIIKEHEEVRVCDEEGNFLNRIDIIITINGVRYGFSAVRNDLEYVAKKVQPNKDFIHCIVHVISPRNFKHPSKWSFGGMRYEGNLYKEEEKFLFKKFEEYKIPVVFVVNFDHEPNIALMYLRKTYADLAIGSDVLANIDNFLPKDGFRSSFLSPLYSRGTLMNLGSEGPAPKCGVVRLLQVIYESILHAKYSDGSQYDVNTLNLPDYYKNLGLIIDLFNYLAAIVIGNGDYLDDSVSGENNPFLALDGKKRTLFDYETPYADLFTDVFDADLELCLDKLVEFATGDKDKQYWNYTKGFLQDITNNWAIGNKYYILSTLLNFLSSSGIRLHLPQTKGYDNNSNGWHEPNKYSLLNNSHFEDFSNGSL